MNQARPPHPPGPDDWELDPVWDLLDQAPAAAAGPRFAERVSRLVRLEAAAPPDPWWKKLLAPAPVGGLAAASAAIALAVVLLTPGETAAPPMADRSTPIPAASSVTVSDAALPVEARIASIQEAAETEFLIAAADHLDAFSDQELVSLIGF